MRGAAVWMAILLVIVGAVGLTAWSERLPAPRGDSAPADSFSAARAMEVLRLQTDLGRRLSGTPNERLTADRLAARLREIPGVEPLPSATNFLLVRLPTDGAPVVRELGERGVYVRSFPNPKGGLTDCLRVSIGDAEENAIFANELEAVLDEARTAR